MAELKSLEPLMVDELRDLLDAEKQLTRALPKLAKAASSPDLRAAFEEHLRQTEDHIDRLNEVFDLVGAPARGKKCVGLQGVIEEGQETIEEAEEGAVRDAALIASAQKAEHYEMAAYGTVRTWANILGHNEAARLLEQTLEDEKTADRKLSEIAEGLVNPMAAEEEAPEGTEVAKTRRVGRVGKRPPEITRRQARGTTHAADRHRGGRTGKSARRAASHKSGRRSSGRKRS